MKNKINIRKITLTGIFIAISVVGSLFSFPVFRFVPCEKRFYMGEKELPADSFFVRIYVFAAVRYELWHPDDTGISQLLWHNDYGSVFCCGQN